VSINPGVRKRSGKAWMPPGSLVHVGDQRAASTSLSIIDYNENRYEVKTAQTAEECFPFKESPTVTWINVEGISNVPLLEKLGAGFAVHPLILEDILNTDQRPKVDDMESYLYLVLKMIDYDGRHSRLTSEQVSLVLGTNFVISFQEGLRGDVFNPVRARIQNGRGRIRKSGSDYLTYALLDGIVDNYFVVLEKLGEKIEELEDVLIANPKPETIHDIHSLKRDMLFLRRSIWPLRDVVGLLLKSESSLIKDSTEIFLRDVYDHLIQAIDTIEIHREMLSGMLDIYLSSVSNRMNQVMKVLTIIATIFMPLTFLAGVYGMNFRFMPELGWRWGYPLVLLLMTVVGVLMVLYFKRKKWM